MAKGLASFRAILRNPAGNPSSAFDFIDDFSSDQLATNYVITGAQFSVSGGELVPGSNALSTIGLRDRFYTDFEQVMAIHTGAVVNHDIRIHGRIKGVSPVDVTNGVRLRHTNGTLQLQTVGKDTQSFGFRTVGGPVGGSPMQPNSKYWLVFRAIGDVLTGEFWNSDPATGGQPATSITLTLRPEEGSYGGTSGSGQGYMNWTLQAFQADYTFDDLRVHPLCIDIAPYMRVAQGEGMDPANSDYLTPAFADSPLRDGGFLVNLDSKNRETQWPLALSSATSKDDLRQKQSAINGLLSLAGTQLEWRDDGATRSTFLDLQAGRLDEQYNFRREQRWWANCLVHLWTSPFGHTNNNRIIGTLSGSGAVQGMPMEFLSNDPSNMISSGDFELGVLGLGSWSAQAGASIMQVQTIPTVAPAFVGDYVMRVWSDGTVLNEGVKVPVVFASGAASSLNIQVRLRNSRSASLPIQVAPIEQSGGIVAGNVLVPVGTGWTNASLSFSIPAASLSGSYAIFIRDRATDMPSLTFEIDQVVVTMNSFPTLSIPSALDGDTDAKAVWQVTAGSQVPGPAAMQNGRYIGVAALPASYTWLVPAASLQGSAGYVGTIVGASGVQASQIFNALQAGVGGQWSASYGPVPLRFTLPNGPAYAGRNRVYALGRSNVEPVSGLYLADWENNRVGPTVVASGFRDMHLYDLGVFTVPTAGAPSQLTMTLYGRHLLGFTDDYLTDPQTSQLNEFGINELIVLPESYHALLVDDYDIPSQIIYDNFSATSTLAGHTSDSGHTWATALSNASGGAMGLSNTRGGNLVYGGAAVTPLSAAVRVPSQLLQSFRAGLSARVQAFNSAPTYYWGLRKETSATNIWFGVKYAASNAGGGPFLAVEAMYAAGATLFASVALPTIVNSNRYQLYAEFRPDSVIGYLLDQNPNNPTLIMASLMASGMANMSDSGDPGIYFANGSTNSNIFARMYDFRVESIPTQRIAPRDVYVLDGVAGEAYRRPQAGDIQQRLTHKLRGKIPRVPVPSTARLVAFALGLPEGVANDQTDLQVQLREQFLFAR